MGRVLSWGRLALAAGLVTCAAMGVPVAALADTDSCAQFRKDLLEMERTSVRPPGWVMLDSVLRASYARNCVVEPTRRPQAEYWFAEDGSPLGVRADFTPDGWDTKANGPYRPDRGAFTTTPEIGAFCARQGAPFNPGMCALIKGLEADCRQPPDSQARGAQCKEILAGSTPDLPPPSAPLPPAFGLVGPAPATAPQMSDAAVHADPGFQRMCAQAKANMDSCAMRRQNMTSLPGGSGLGSTGQAGAFLECQQLYGQVYAMCAATEQAALKAPAPAPGAPPKAAPPAAPAPRGGGPGASSLPPAPPAAPQMSAKCQALVKNLVDAAEANEGAKSQAAYGALKQAGGCGVLAQFDRAPPAAGGDSRFVARGETPLSDGVMGACDAAPDECAARVQQLKAGTSPAAVAALWANAIGIGLDMGNALASGMLAGMPSPGTIRGGNTNMNSIGNRPVRSTYGQGAPTYRPAPRQTPSDITGTTR